MTDSLTYVERELVPLGFRFVERRVNECCNVTTKIVLAYGRLEFLFRCSCPSPTSPTSGCSLHHEGTDIPWAVDDAKRVRLALMS